MSPRKKKCNTCKAKKPVDDFWRQATGRDGRYSDCKKCAYKKQRKNLKKRLKVDPLYSAKRQKAWEQKGRNTLRKVLRKYSITVDEYDTMLHKQNGKCPVCDERLDDGKGIDIDHDHKTRVARGILHHKCNFGIGLLKDSPEICRRAAEYLEKGLAD